MTAFEIEALPYLFDGLIDRVCHFRAIYLRDDVKRILLGHLSLVESG
jgi:hypothetical protein